MFMRYKVTVNTSHYGKEGPSALPEGWCWTTLKEVCSIRGGKRIPKGKSFAKEKTAHVYIRVTDMKNMTVDMNDLKYIDDDVYGEISRYIIEKDDLYLTIAGTIGKVGEIPEELHGMNLTENAARLTDIACDKLYLMYALQTDVVQSHFSMRFHQVAQPKLSIETASSTLIALPPLFEQKRIVSAIQTLLTCIDSIEVEQHELDTNVENAKERILDLAIHGKLVPQDPSDEPAIEFLKRINPAFQPSHNLHYIDCPTGWAIATVSDIFEINPRVQAPDDADAGFVAMANICDGFDDVFSYEVRKWGSIKKGFTRFEDGDIAVAKISPCLENRKSVILRNLPNGIGAGTTELNIFRSSIVVPEYGLMFFKSDYFINSCAGSYNGVVGQQRVSRSLIEEMPFLLPPIDEQRRIISAVNDYFAVLNRIEAALE